MRKTKIGNFILNRRQALDLTQLDVAKKLGYKHGNFIGMLEKGQAYFPVEKWKAYARALQTNELQFLRIVLEECYPDMLPYFRDDEDERTNIMKA
jgi:transcriptional regulator with XRE-family HTH domain